MKKVVFLGNCQATRLYVLYNERFLPVTGDRTDMVVSFVDGTPQGRKALAEADVIVAQVTDAEQKVGVDRTATNAQIIQFPNVTGMFLWPFSGEPHIFNSSLPYQTDGPYGQQFGNRWLDRRLKSGARPDDIAAEYEAADLSRLVNLDRMYDLVMERARERDRKTGFAIAALIEKSLADTPLFMTPANLELSLFQALATGVYERLGIPSSTVETVLASLWRSPFPIADHPIHPSVARHFGLKFIGPATRYRTFSGERLTFRAWISRYVHYKWNDAILQGAYKGSRMRRFDAEAEAALQQIDAGLAESDGSAYGLCCRSHLLKLKGDHAGALKATAAAAAFDTDDPQIVGTLMLYRAEAGELDEAERLGRHVTTSWPYYAEGWNRLGIVLARRQDYTAAANAIRRAVTLDPLNADFYKHLASVQNRAGQPERAQDTLASAIALLPGRADLQLELSRLFGQLGNLDAALKTARIAIELGPQDVTLYENLAGILERRGDFVSACNVLREAIAISPRQIGLYSALAQLLMQLGRHDDAVVELHRTIALAPGHADLRATLALAVYRQGRLDESLSIIDEAIAITPDNPHLLVRKSFLLKEKGDFAQAIAVAETAIALAPRIGGLYATLAAIHVREGSLQSAVAAFRTAAALEPGNQHYQDQIEHLSRLERESHQVQAAE